MTSPTGISNQSAIVRNFYTDDAMILGMYVTRIKQHVWLIGDPLENILGAKLPSGRDVMRNQSQSEKREHSRRSQPGIHTDYTHVGESAYPDQGAKQDVIIKIKDLYNERQLLNKRRQRTTPANLRNQVEYTRRMYALFDIAQSTRIGSFFTNNEWTGLGRSTKALLFVSALPQLGPRIGREPPRDTPPRSKPPTETDAHGLIVTNAEVHHIIFICIYNI